MKRAKLALIEITWTGLIWSILFAFPNSAAKAVQAPSEGCRPASKIEYNTAKQQILLRNRFGMYVRTGRWWRRHYWYCH
jgi:hypothetical protein